jgi:hypothetical protein
VTSQTVEKHISSDGLLKSTTAPSCPLRLQTS